MLDSPRLCLDDVEIVERKTVYQGFFRMQEVALRHRLHDGGWSATLRRELFVREDAVAVLLYDVARDAVVLIEQFRVGALQDPLSPWLLELVAGIVEPGETHSQVARRESQEEAGVDVSQLQKIGSVHLSPGGTQEMMHIYCGLVESEGVGGVHGLVEEGEDIRVEVVSRADAWAAVVSGRINNAPALIALQWLQLNADRLASL